MTTAQPLLEQVEKQVITCYLLPVFLSDLLATVCSHLGGF